MGYGDKHVQYCRRELMGSYCAGHFIYVCNDPGQKMLSSSFIDSGNEYTEVQNKLNNLAKTPTTASYNQPNSVLLVNQ